VHLNVPAPNRTYLQKFGRKLGIFCLALIAPELVVMLAMRQWMAASLIIREARIELSKCFIFQYDY
jgi:hypothetical protein